MLRQLGVNEHLTVHPQCPNNECGHVYYKLTRREEFAEKLPSVCPECQTSWRDGANKPKVLHFGRRTLQAELEHVMRVKGIEAVIERARDRKEKRDEEDERSRTRGEASWSKVWRQQDDGSTWMSRRAQNANPAIMDALLITVNFGIDWANPSSRRSAASDLMGPITLYLADMPAQLRSAFCCTMIVGITPGPREPKEQNLHKNLLPIMLELRAAELYGLWVRTPTHPAGKYP